jgi:hypothetical protein
MTKNGVDFAKGCSLRKLNVHVFRLLQNNPDLQDVENFLIN